MAYENSHESDYRPWKWTRRFAVGLSASVAGFSAWNFIAPFLPPKAWDIPMADLVAAFLLAAIVGNAQGLANCMAANARRVGAAGHEKAGRACWVFCIGFAAVSWFGLHNAWEMVSGSASGFAFPDPLLMDALFAFIAMSEPTMNWVVDLLKALAKAEEAADDAAMRDAAAAREAAQRSREPRRDMFRVVAGTAAAVGLATAIPTPSHAIQPVQENSHENPGAPVGISRPDWLGPRDIEKWDRVQKLNSENYHGAAIIRETGYKAATVYRWLRIMNAGKVEAA